MYPAACIPMLSSIGQIDLPQSLNRGLRRTLVQSGPILTGGVRMNRSPRRVAAHPDTLRWVLRVEISIQRVPHSQCVRRPGAQASLEKWPPQPSRQAPPHEV